MAKRPAIFVWVLVAGLAAAAAAQTRPATRASSRPASRPAARSATTRSATSRATSRPAEPDKAAEKVSQDALRVAVATLTREATQALSKKEAFPRGEPDYFKLKPAAVAQDDLLKIVSRQLNPDPRVDAYVKLQLLSAVEKFDAAHARAALTAYVTGAPPLVPMPMSPKDLQPWAARAMAARTPNDVARTNDEYAAWRQPYEEANAPMIRTRDVLRDRITITDELKGKLLQARIEELSERAAAGLDVWKQETALFAEVEKWTPLAKKGDVHEMIQFMTEYTKRVGPDVPDKLVWSSDRKTAKWKERVAGLDDKKVAKLIEKLTEAERNAL